MRGKIGFAILLVLTAGLGLLFSGMGPENDTYIFPFKFRPALLSGTFGELRGNHFHSGIDVKTGGEVGKPIYAARDGYVYRLKVSPWGFGRAVYLRHPDGEFTVYAHLDQFIPKFEEFVYQKQYASKKYEQEIYLEPDVFEVKQGELIAYSGNSGSSTGPHLHYEIRDPEERITNPLRYYKSIITDNIPPTVGHIGVEPLTAESRVSGEFEKLEITPSGSPGNYTVPGVLEVSGPVGLEYHGWDLLNGAGNHCGINYAQLFLDDKLIYEFAIDKYGFDEKKFINVHFDYQFYRRNGRKYQRCYLAEGNGFSCYKNLENRGIIHLKDDLTHNFKLLLKDSYENTTVVSGKMKRVPLDNSPSVNEHSGGISLRSYVRRNVLVVRVKNYRREHFEGLNVQFDKGEAETLKPAYRSGNQLYFLLPLGKWRFPNRIVDPVSKQELGFDFRKTILPEKNNIVDHEEAQLLFPVGSVFDTLQLEVSTSPRQSGMYSKIYKIGDTEVPLYKSFVLNIKPEVEGNPTHMVIAEKNRYGRWNYLSHDVHEDGSVYGSAGSFGEFCVMADSAAPRIKPLNFGPGDRISANQSTLRVRLTDNFAGIDSRRIVLTLDGSWILAEFDAKSSTITHRLVDRPASGKHIVGIITYDNANNMAKEEFELLF